MDEEEEVRGVVEEEKGEVDGEEEEIDKGVDVLGIRAIRCGKDWGKVDAEKGF